MMSEIESLRIDFIVAHVLFCNLVYCVADEVRYAKDVDDFFDLVPRLGAFIASVLGVSLQEAADKTIDMIQDESAARAFFDEHFSSVAS